MVKPTQIFDNSANITSRKKNKQKNTTKKEMNHIENVNVTVEEVDTAENEVHTVKKVSNGSMRSDEEDSTREMMEHEECLDKNTKELNVKNKSSVDGETDNGEQNETSRDADNSAKTGGNYSSSFVHGNAHNVVHDIVTDKVNNEEIKSNNAKNDSYAKTLTKNLIADENRLFTIPTCINSQGKEVVLFDEDLVMEGCEKWKLTVCGYFVGCKMHINVLKYNIRRMWTKFGLKDIVVDADEMCFFKFKNEEGMKHILEQSPWVVNGKPLIVQKWDPEVMVKENHCKIPVWIRLYNVPLEAWSIKGISAISSRLGRPIMMDKMTTDMCKEGSGRLGYASVLVEVNAEKEYLEKNEINYVDALEKVKMKKWVKVEYSWKLDKCSHCKVFSHTNFQCSDRQKEVKNGANKEARVVENKDNNEGFVEVRNRNNMHGRKVGMNNGLQGNKKDYKGNVMNIQQKYVVKQKVSDPISKDGDKSNGNSNKDQGNADGSSNGVERSADLNTKKKMDNFESISPPSLEKIWNVGPKKIVEMRRSANKYAILSEENNNVEFDGNVCKDDRLIVDRYILGKAKLPPEELIKWTYDMKLYYIYRWEAVNREYARSDEEDILEECLAANSLVADEIGGGDSQLLN
ncbi:RNA-directed DNA polymerase, eukaryota, reverse transcriptase zinc-binding domain protein [Tanacetum coccineum]